jgi:membrane protein
MNNFAQLNRIFGSVGALIALMLWLNFIALSLLIGFELNVSIKNARLNNNELLEME